MGLIKVCVEQSNILNLQARNDANLDIKVTKSTMCDSKSVQELSEDIIARLTGA